MLQWCCKNDIHALFVVDHEDDPDFREYSHYADISTARRQNDEVNVYLALTPPPSTKSLLETWKDFEDSLPKLHFLAMRTFCVQASSTPSERLFSDAGNIFKEDKLDDLLFLKWNSA